MIRKRGEMSQPVKNGTQYEKCTLAGFSMARSILAVHNPKKPFLF